MTTYLATVLTLLSTAAAAQDYAAWAKKNTDGNWTSAAEMAVTNSQLVESVPKDINNFCPAYSTRNAEDRKVFWVGLLSIVARPESNFKPEAKYTENFADAQGNKVVSRGLLQISIESANQKKYACGIKKAEDLHDPAANLACGVKILDAWVKTDHVIAAYGTGAPRGGGRYWSTLREKNKHLAEIMKFTRSLKVCSAA